MAPRGGEATAVQNSAARWPVVRVGRAVGEVNPEIGEPVDTFTIVTTRANKLLNELHDRMLVVIMPADHQRWLADAEPTAKKLLVPDTGTMTITPVSDRVNDIKQDDAGLIAPLFG